MSCHETCPVYLGAGCSLDRSIYVPTKMTYLTFTRETSNNQKALSMRHKAHLVRARMIRTTVDRAILLNPLTVLAFARLFATLESRSLLSTFDSDKNTTCRGWLKSQGTEERSDQLVNTAAVSTQVTTFVHNLPFVSFHISYNINRNPIAFLPTFTDSRSKAAFSYATQYNIINTIFFM